MIKHFITGVELTPQEQHDVVLVATLLKNRKREFTDLLRGHSVGLYFEKPSLRTRISAETACYALGANAVALRKDEMHFNRGEEAIDGAKVMGGYLDLLLARVYKQSLLEELVQASALPIINGLSDELHPIQSLADLQTINESFNFHTNGLRVALVGDGGNVLTSLAIALSRAGIDCVLSCPADCYPIQLDLRLENGGATGSIDFNDDPRKAVKNVDVIYTDVWVSMGQEDKNLDKFKPYQVNRELLAFAKSSAVVMHCLPAHFNEEITREVFDCKNSRIIEQAHNRKWSVASLYLYLLDFRKFKRLREIA